MEETPDYFLPPRNLNFNSGDIKKFEDYIHNITFELSKNTKEISFFCIPDSSINKYS